MLVLKATSKLKLIRAFQRDTLHYYHCSSRDSKPVSCQSWMLKKMWHFGFEATISWINLVRSCLNIFRPLNFKSHIFAAPWGARMYDISLENPDQFWLRACYSRSQHIFKVFYLISKYPYFNTTHLVGMYKMTP